MKIEYKYKSLIEQILELTKAGSIAWNPGSFKGSFQTILGKGGITVFFMDDDPYQSYPAEMPLSYISFSNERGEVFKSFSVDSPKEEEYPLFDELFKAARETYVKENETLKSMFSDVQSRYK